MFVTECSPKFLRVTNHFSPGHEVGGDQPLLPLIIGDLTPKNPGTLNSHLASVSL